MYGKNNESDTDFEVEEVIPQTQEELDKLLIDLKRDGVIK
jgi:hypothetical protein